MSHDPLSPTDALRTPAGAILGGVSLLVLGYSLVIVGQILFGVIVVLTLSVGPYLSYRLFAALDSIADAAQRVAAVREREAGGATRATNPDDRRVERAADQPSTESTRPTEPTWATDDER